MFRIIFNLKEYLSDMERAIFRKINAFPKAKEEVILWVFGMLNYLRNFGMQ